MERRTFVLATLALPFSVPNLLRWGVQTGPGFKVSAGEGRYHGHIQSMGVNTNIIDIKVSGKDTDGGLLLFEQNHLTPGKGTPLHMHPSQDEVFYVLEGEFLFQVGKEKYSLKTGESIFMPRNVPHSWIQISVKGHTLVSLQPAGKLEELFVAFSSLKKPPTPDETVKLFAAHDIQVLGPPVAKE